MLRNARGRALQRLALKLGQRHHTGNFFNQISLAFHVHTPRRHVGHVALKHEAEAFQNPTLLFCRNGHTHQRLNAIRVELISAVQFRHLASNHNVRRFTATEIHDHLRRQFDRFHIEGRIDTAFVSITRVRVNLQSAARIGDLDRVPDSGFKEDICGFLGTTRRQATHDTCNAFDTFVVRNHHLTFRESVFFFVQTDQSFATLRAMNAQVAVDLICIKNVQRAIAVEGKEVGHIHQSRDRT